MEEITKWEFYVAGVQHHEIYKCLKDMEVGDNLLLRPEPTNRFDSNAIRIEYMLDDIFLMIGYVPGKISMWIAEAINRPGKTTTCKIIELNKEEKPWKQIKVVITKED